MTATEPDTNELIEALVERLKDGVPGITVTRRLADPNPEDMPCLNVGVTVEETNEGEAGGFPDWIVRVGCLLWVRDQSDTGPVPAVLAVNKAIKEALRRQDDETHGNHWTTLGGLAWYAMPIGMDSLPDLEASDQGLATIRIQVRARPVR